MGYVYGPVPSRRLGNSLGIDPIPMKTCNWNCVYCQLGRTRRLARERRPYIRAVEILTEVEAALQQRRSEEIDWITVVGSGEPTLNSEIGEIIRGIKGMSSIPVAVITNGSLLTEPEVREELSQADAVMPTLDAGTEELYRRINRPRRSLTVERQIEGLRRFREEFTGSLWIEVMLVAGLNDTEEELTALAERLRRIGPDRIDLSHPERPPCEPWVEPTDREGQLRALAILGEAARVLPPTPQEYDFSGGDVAETIVGIIQRHPLPDEELRRHLPSTEEEELLRKLSEGGRVQRVKRYGRWFWTSKEGSYANDR